MATYVPQGLDFADTAPIRIEATQVVTSSPAEVWAVLCDHERWPEWFGRVKACRPTSEGTGVGSTREVVLSTGQRFHEEFIAWDEPGLWAFTGLEGPPGFRSLVERVTVRDVEPGRTEVTYRMAIEPSRGFGWFLRLVRSQVQGNLQHALANLDGAVAARGS